VGKAWHAACNSSGDKQPGFPGVPNRQEALMNQDILQGKWEQLKGEARVKWGKLTNDDIDQIEGQREKLVGKLRERYGLARDRAERDVDEWLKNNPH
jgi:uncharacterized protein YjbJ (UPF0337 family)